MDGCVEDQTSEGTRRALVQLGCLRESVALPECACLSEQSCFSAMNGALEVPATKSTQTYTRCTSSGQIQHLIKSVFSSRRGFIADRCCHEI